MTKNNIFLAFEICFSLFALSCQKNPSSPQTQPDPYTFITGYWQCAAGTNSDPLTINLILNANNTFSFWIRDNKGGYDYSQAAGTFERADTNLFKNPLIKLTDNSLIYHSTICVGYYKTGVIDSKNLTLQYFSGFDYINAADKSTWWWFDKQ
jgi:hypothetical protein